LKLCVGACIARPQNRDIINNGRPMVAPTTIAIHSSNQLSNNHFVLDANILTLPKDIDNI